MFHIQMSLSQSFTFKSFVPKRSLRFLVGFTTMVYNMIVILGIIIIIICLNNQSFSNLTEAGK